MIKQPKILLVDDDEDLLQILRLYMKAPEYRLTTALDGNSAMEMIRRDKPDVVLLDLMMPETDGFVVCSRIKTDPKLKDVKVIIMTQADSRANRDKAKALGADDFLPKGTDRFELVRSIEMMLDRL